MNLLFIAPIFFDYEKTIANILGPRYDKVLFRAEVPFNSSVRFYALRRLWPKLADKALEGYSKNLLQLVENEHIDRIFIIRGYGIQADFLAGVRERFPQIEIINYQWDSIQNNPNGLNISKYAHINYSFDLADVAQYPQFTHLPLFYTWDSLGPARTDPQTVTKDIDLLFVGGYHSKRHEIVELARQECEKQGLNMFSHIYLPAGSYLRDRLTTQEINRKDVCFEKIPRSKYYELLCRSRAVLDIQSSIQTGATMRTFETLSVGGKIISTNKMLQKETFFSEANIKIWTPGKPLDMTDILTTPFDHAKDPEIFSVHQWLDRIGV